MCMCRGGCSQHTQAVDLLCPAVLCKMPCSLQGCSVCQFQASDASSEPPPYSQDKTHTHTHTCDSQAGAQLFPHSIRKLLPLNVPQHLELSTAGHSRDTAETQQDTRTHIQRDRQAAAHSQCLAKDEAAVVLAARSCNAVFCSRSLCWTVC